MKLRTIWLALPACLSLSCGGGSDVGAVTPPPLAQGVFAYVSNSDSNNITAHKVNPISGALTPVPESPFGGVNAPLGMTLDPSSNFLAVGNLNGGAISVFHIDKATGTASSVPGSPFPTTGGGFPAHSLFHTSGKFFYAGLMLSQASDISGFSVDSSGVLTPLPHSPFHGQTYPGGGGVFSLALHPAGDFLYASGFFLGITGYAVDSVNGDLVQLPGSPFIPDGAFFNTRLVVHPTGNFLYMADFDVDGVRVFPIAADGSIGAEIAGSPFFSGTGVRDITLNPAGTFAFVINDGDSDVTAFAVDPISGQLTFIGNASTGIGPFAATTDSLGKFLYVTNQTDGNVSAYSIDPTSGSLSPVAGSPFAAGNSPISIVVSK